MRPEDLLVDVLRHWWIVALPALAAVVIAYLTVSNRADEYRASVTMVVEAEPANYWTDLYVKNSLPIFERLIDNQAFVRQSLSTAELDFDVAHAANALVVTHDSSSNLLTITVVDTDGRRAAETAGAVQGEFERIVDDRNASNALLDAVPASEVMPRVRLTIIEATGPPSDPVDAGLHSALLASILLGGMIGSAAVLFLRYRNDTLRSPDDLERYLARPLLGVVPDANSPLER